MEEMGCDTFSRQHAASERLSLNKNLTQYAQHYRESLTRSVRPEGGIVRRAGNCDISRSNALHLTFYVFVSITGRLP